MKIKYVLLPTLILITAGCAQTSKQDTAASLNQIANSVTSLSSKVDQLSERVNTLDSASVNQNQTSTIADTAPTSSDRDSVLTLLNKFFPWDVKDLKAGEYASPLAKWYCSDSKITGTTNLITTLQYGPVTPDKSTIRSVTEQIKKVLTENGWTDCSSWQNPDGTQEIFTYEKNSMQLQIMPSYSMGAGHFLQIQFEHSSSVQVNNSTTWKKYSYNNYSFDIPSNWNATITKKKTATMGSYDEVSFTDASQKNLATLHCPIREIGYEAWTISQKKERSFTKSYEQYTATLRLMTSAVGDIDSLDIIFMNKGESFENWSDAGNYQLSCELLASGGVSMDTIFTHIFDSIQ